MSIWQRKRYANEIARREDEEEIVLAQVAYLVDRPALDAINEIVSADTWSVGMLEDICSIVRSTGRPVVPSNYLHH